MSRKRSWRGVLDFTLTDTGPLVALINANDPYYERAKGLLPRLPKAPFRTTWPCFTEAMYLLRQAAGYPAQDELWRFVAIGLVQLHSHEEAEWWRMRELMRTYRDTPMDMADASLIAAAEALSTDQVFTFDKHFYAYRLADGSALGVVD